MASKEKHYSYSKHELLRMANRIKSSAVEQTMILVAAYLMEEPEFDYSDERILELWQGISRWSVAVKDHTISCEKVCDIINQNTGLNIHWGKGAVKYDKDII